MQDAALNPFAQQQEAESGTDTLRDPRQRAVRWRDLVGVSPLQVLIEPLLSSPSS